MNVDEKLISNVTYKVNKLIDLYQDQKSENLKLTTEISTLKIKIENQNNTIKELENKINGLTLANLLKSNTEISEAKARINELVREIDHCIGLLNN